MRIETMNSSQSTIIKINGSLVRKCLVAAFVGGVFFVASSTVAFAQMPQDVRDVFEGMLEHLDDDVREKFQAAIDKDTTKVEFTPDQLKRFRKNPANPFEGLDEINLKDRQAKVVLNFELPSMRNRDINVHERQHRSILNGLRSPVASAAASTVKIFSEKRHVALGTIVQADGLVLTKLSEVENRPKVRVERNGKSYPAKIFKQDRENDLAILKIKAKNLPVIAWSNVTPKLGAFVLTASAGRQPLALGTYSVQPRSTREGEQAFLGVQPIVAMNGVRVTDIQPGSASYDAGIRDNDVITKIAGKPTFDVASLVKVIREHRPGDQVTIEYRRNGAKATTQATFAGRGIAGERAARFKMMNRLGAVPSRRDGNFPSVFQHDTPLFPEQCGGPMVDLDGQVIGLNIARKGRAASYALPATHVKTLIDEMLREDVASRDVD